MALGSWVCTRAPAASSPSMRGMVGLSRMSSVSALKASPQIPTILPVRSLPRYLSALCSTTRFCASLTSSTALSTSSERPRESAVWMIAFTSLGKQEPP